MSDDRPNLRPWQRAGYSWEEWIKGLRVVTKRRLEATRALSAFYGVTQVIDSEKWLEKAKELEAAEDAARERSADYRAGDPETAAEILDEMDESE